MFPEPLGVRDGNVLFREFPKSVIFSLLLAPGAFRGGVDDVNSELFKEFLRFGVQKQPISR